MTHHDIKVLEDGTRVYSNGTRYKPVAPEDRKRKTRKPESKTAFFWRGEWHEPHTFLDDDERDDPARIVKSAGLRPPRSPRR